MNLTGKGGFQERKQHINRKGRPRSFNQIRALAQSIAHEKITDANGEVMTRVECILHDWSESKDVQKQIAFVQYGYGKPVDRVELDELKPKIKLRLFYAHEDPSHPSFRPEAFAKLPEDEQKMLSEHLNGENGEPDSESPPTPLSS
jgi:hypothetical protein